MYFKYIVLYSLIIVMAYGTSCGKRCPDLNSPHILVIFEGNATLKKVSGIGGGNIQWQGNDTTATGKKRTLYLLELAVNSDTTTYIFKGFVKDDTLTVSAKNFKSYNNKCGFYVAPYDLKVKNESTSFTNITVNAYSSIPTSIPYTDHFPIFYIKE